MSRTTRTTATAAALIALLTATGCQSSSANPPAPSPEPSPIELTVRGGVGSSHDGPEDAPSGGHGHVTSTPTPTAVHPSRAALQELFFLPHPEGPPSQIALRFLKALQDEDFLSAAAELGPVGRAYFASQDDNELRTVLTDVARNAQVKAAGRCDGARQLNATSSVVFCGSQAVVVHVFADRYGSGVLLSDRHPQGDYYEGSHTHAFTSLGP